MLRKAGDRGEAVVSFEAQDLDRAKAFLTSADLGAEMRAVGVVDKPDSCFLAE